MYRLSDSLPVDAIPDGSNLLISGPPMTGKYDLMLQLLIESCENVVVLSTKNSADRIRDDVADVPAPSPEVGVVDCVSRQRNLGPTSEGELTKYVSSPQNLTQIGVKFTVLFDRFYEEQPEEFTGVGLHSISHLLMYSDVKQVYQFLQVLTGKVQSAGWLGFGIIDSSIHDEKTQNTLQNLFDGVVQTKRGENGERRLRVTGLSSQPTDWVTF
jgi:hypothetical protein